MNKTRMTFVNRGGKLAAGTVAGEEQSDPERIQGRPSRKLADKLYGNLDLDRPRPAGRRSAGAAGRDDQSPATRSSRI